MAADLAYPAPAPYDIRFTLPPLFYFLMIREMGRS